MLYVHGQPIAVVDQGGLNGENGIPPDQRGGMELAGSTQAWIGLTELDQVFPAGRYRFIATGDTVELQRLTATSGWSATQPTPWSGTTQTLGVWSSVGAQTTTVLDAVTTVTQVLTLNHNTTGSVAAGLGTGIQLGIETSTTNSVLAATIEARWSTATHATRTSDLYFFVESD